MFLLGSLFISKRYKIGIFFQRIVSHTTFFFTKQEKSTNLNKKYYITNIIFSTFFINFASGKTKHRRK